MKLRPIASKFTLKDHVYDRLREAILEMDIYDQNADLRLDERSLAEQLNISRTPLRDAIARLEADGLVTVVPRKGVYVQRKSLEEILEMIIAWAALESMAARLAATAATDIEIAMLRKIASKYNDELSATRIAEYSDDNLKFHLHILEISHCALLKSMAEGLFLHIQAVRLRSMWEGDRVKRSVVDHAEIIEALERRDADEAAERVREHTMQLHQHIRKTWGRLELTRNAALNTA
ncbi:MULTISPECIES: GntR family transcriptional regulator [unclassified Roseovarius]|jgi:DNA-binding GntR family transcriptional regulator|uniref:GntR family transcriptional regulator n=1 Tax=unclassified Roseovarius TaxID=2614913 RepID=UPI0000686501|nr:MULTISPECIES: GntR family transcriptional regulator [unclassified Roseovarius]EAQ24010.1 regulatory protein GntR, HTH:GntR, C-terminal [Roseovarius sp. 217]KJS44736.1 MAG: GntR family transcriptional regulator [Roseovarius sp. BRH_c41]